MKQAQFYYLLGDEIYQNLTLKNQQFLAILHFVLIQQNPLFFNENKIF